MREILKILESMEKPLVTKPKEQSLDDLIAQKAERDAMLENGRVIEGAFRRFVGTGTTTEHDETQPASMGLVERELRDACKHSKWPVSGMRDHGYLVLYANMPSGARCITCHVNVPKAQDGDMENTWAGLMGRKANVVAVVDRLNAMACPECDGKGQVRGEIFLAEDACKGCNGSGLRT